MSDGDRELYAKAAADLKASIDAAEQSRRLDALRADAPAMLNALRALSLAANRVFERYVDVCDELGGYPVPTTISTELADAQRDVRALLDKHGRA